jgi:hypothetical protein
MCFLQCPQKLYACVGNCVCTSVHLHVTASELLNRIWLKLLLEFLPESCIAISNFIKLDIVDSIFS